MNTDNKDIAIFNALTSADNAVLVKALFNNKEVSVIGLMDADKIYPLAILLNDELRESLEEDLENSEI